MGLVTTNFYLEKRQEVLPQAYAVIRELNTYENGHGKAIIGIDKTRELAINPLSTPLQEKEIYFIVNRNESPYITAYKKATIPHTEKIHNEETGKVEEVEVKPFFYGWDKDIR